MSYLIINHLHYDQFVFEKTHGKNVIKCLWPIMLIVVVRLINHVSNLNDKSNVDWSLM